MARGLPDLPSPQQEALADLPPSAKLITIVLLEEGELTQKQLVEATRLSARTIRHALNELEEAEIVASRKSFMDARQQLYSIEGSQEATAAQQSLAPE